MIKQTKPKVPQNEDTKIKDFIDMIAPGIIKFQTDHFICGNTFRCVWTLREYPTVTEEQAILRHLGEKDGVTLRIYTRQVTPTEEKRIIHNATNKNRMNTANTNDLQESVTAESNLQDVVTLVSTMHRNREPLLHCAVYIELTARDYDNLKLLQTDVLTELVRSKLNVDRLLLRQQQGFLCVGPSGRNIFAVSSNEFFQPHPLQICIPLIIRERQTATVFIWAEISLAVTFLWILISEMMTKPILVS